MAGTTVNTLPEAATIWEATAAIIACLALALSVWSIFIQRSYQRLENFYHIQTRFNSMADEFEHLIALKDVKTFTNWSVDDKVIAFRVCGELHDIGVLMAYKLIEPRIFIHLWFYTLPLLISATEEYVEDIRKSRGEPYWGGLRVLSILIDRHLSGFRGFPERGIIVRLMRLGRP